LGYLSIEVECATCDGEGRRDDGSDEGECMLEAEEDSEQNWNLVVKPVERCFVIFVFTI
jgi:hypothetical protein